MPTSVPLSSSCPTTSEWPATLARIKDALARIPDACHGAASGRYCSRGRGSVGGERELMAMELEAGVTRRWTARHSKRVCTRIQSSCLRQSRALVAAGPLAISLLRRVKGACARCGTGSARGGAALIKKSKRCEAGSARVQARTQAARTTAAMRVEVAQTSREPVAQTSREPLAAQIRSLHRHLPPRPFLLPLPRRRQDFRAGPSSARRSSWRRPPPAGLVRVGPQPFRRRRSPLPALHQRLAGRGRRCGTRAARSAPASPCLALHSRARPAAIAWAAGERCLRLPPAPPDRQYFALHASHRRRLR